MQDSKKRKLRVFIAEDDDDDYFLLEKALAKTSEVFEILRARNGQELLTSLKMDLEEPGMAGPVLILLDLNMPVVDGRSALREIKSHERLKSIPVVVLTTSDADSDVLESYRAGAASFVCKPDDFDELAVVMSRLLGYWTRLVRFPDVL